MSPDSVRTAPDGSAPDRTATKRAARSRGWAGRLAAVTILMAASVTCRDGGRTGAPVNAATSGRPVVATAAAPTRLRWVGDRWPGYYPVFMVRHRFADSAVVSLTIAQPEDTDRMLADFAAGRYDLVAASFADLLSLQQLVPDLRVVLCTDESAGADGIVANRSIRDVSALRGRRIGVNLGGFAELLVETMLRKHGLTPADVELVDLDAAQIPAALRAGRIDAGETWNPYLSGMRGERYPVLFTSADVPGMIQDCIATREATASRSPGAVREFVRAWLDAVSWMKVHPDSARAFMEQQLSHPVPVIADSSGVHLLGRDEVYERLRGSGPRSLAVLGGTYASFLGRIGALRSPPRLAALIDPRWLPIDSNRTLRGEQ